MFDQTNDGIMPKVGYIANSLFYTIIIYIIDNKKKLSLLMFWTQNVIQ